jgi:hypothetical protein
VKGRTISRRLESVGHVRGANSRHAGFDTVHSIPDTVMEGRVWAPLGEKTPRLWSRMLVRLGVGSGESQRVTADEGRPLRKKQVLWLPPTLNNRSLEPGILASIVTPTRRPYLKASEVKKQLTTPCPVPNGPELRLFWRPREPGPGEIKEVIGPRPRVNHMCKLSAPIVTVAGSLLLTPPS